MQKASQTAKRIGASFALLPSSRTKFYSETQSGLKLSPYRDVTKKRYERDNFFPECLMIFQLVGQRQRPIDCSVKFLTEKTKKKKQYEAIICYSLHSQIFFEFKFSSLTA